VWRVPLTPDPLSASGAREKWSTKWCCLERQRLDKWLWHARVVKARASAAALVEAGHVRINGVREKAPGHGVKAGDVLTIGLDRTVRVLKVIGFAERRGDAQAARVLYQDLQERPE
jgi:ribosome-associated heat shock protein Hsp15